MTGTLVQPQAQCQSDPASRHPMNSSRLMLSLLRLVESGRRRGGKPSVIENLISLPVLRRLLAALNYRDPATKMHAWRTSLISVGIAQRLGWEDESLRIIELAALLHDLGKVGISDHILMKPGRLSPDEASYIGVQQQVAVGLLQACGVQSEVIEIVAQAHGLEEKISSLSGELSLGARILSVADAFDSLTTDQVYRSAYSQPRALEILMEQAGKQFDRNVVSALGRWLETPPSQMLRDHESAVTLTQANLPVTRETIYEASELCHLFSALHSMETLYEGFFILDDRFRVCVWSRGAEKLYSCSGREVLGRSWPEIAFPFPEVQEHAIYSRVQEAMSTGQAACRSIHLRKEDGVVRELEAQLVPLVEDGVIRGTLVMIYDMQQSRGNSGLFRQLQMAATRDALTGVFNRGELEGRLQHFFNEYVDGGESTPFSVIFLDLDHFKAINDRLGHSVGDQVLIEVARLIQDETYSGEVVGRYGGEEFVIVCPNTELEVAIERAERLRRILMSTTIADRTDLRVTASLGVAQLRPGDTVDGVVHRADEALYEAKRTGRNRTCQEPVGHEGSGKKDVKASEWEFRKSLVTEVASDLLRYKLKGFIEGESIRLLKSSAEQIVLQCGQRGLFGWGSQPSRQPVTVTINIGDAPNNGQMSRNRRVLLRVLIEPIGQPAHSETFQQRAMQVLRELQSYCIASIEGQPVI